MVANRNGDAANFFLQRCLALPWRCDAVILAGGIDVLFSRLSAFGRQNYQLPYAILTGTARWYRY